MALNGVLAGLVVITAPCAVVSPFSAIIIGAIGGILVVLSVEFIDKVLHIDDPVGAISVHGICGAWGTLSVGLFAQSSYGKISEVGSINGLFFGGRIKTTFNTINWCSFCVCLGVYCSINSFWNN